MKSFFLIFTITFMSFSSFGFTRIIECNNNINYNLKLSIMIDPGVASLYNCTDYPCSRHDRVKTSETAQIKSANPATNTFHYVITSGNYPAQSTMDITFPRAQHLPPIVAFDGDDSLYTCY